MPDTPIVKLRTHTMTPLQISSLLVLFLLTPILAQANTRATAEMNTGSERVHIANSAKQHFVQFFSTINATKAEGMKNTLLNQGFPAFINVHAQQRKPYYQVQIGPFLSVGTAQQARLKVIRSYPQYSFLNSAILKSTR